MKRKIRPVALVLTFFLLACCSTHSFAANDSKVDVSGDLLQWHKVTLTLDGPQASESGNPNPFTDYRMQVMFRHQQTGLTYVVPGYFAADGNAANTSATSGNKWRVHLSPDHAGTWTYAISFRAGKGIAVNDSPTAGSPVVGSDGLRGTFDVALTDKSGRDMRAKGRLNYVGKHHLQFAGTSEFFLKAGADAPENFLAYKDFDGDFKTDGQKDNLVKEWAPHIKDWRPGDPTWQGGKGKGIIGAINYLASQGLNSFSFLTMNIGGDDRNVFPYTGYNERERIDCSRMDQWEIVLSHGTSMGMYLHFKTQEAENVNLLDGGHLGPQRKLYYRELIARFGHHLALNWNLGEEVGLGHEVSTQKKKDWAEYFWTHDPYHHHIVIHNGNNHYDLLGKGSKLTGFSLQTNQSDFGRVHDQTRNYIKRSGEAGKPWVVACDEPGDASHSLITDREDPTRNNARRNALWGNIMAGGAGVEWYFGYKHPHSDLTCQDYRVREKMWKQCKVALDFFSTHSIPFWNMTNDNGRVSAKDAYCLYQKDRVYLVFLKKGGRATLNLSDAKGSYEVRWYNPRIGGPLQSGSVAVVTGGGTRSIGQPPREQDQDWLALVRPADPNRNYPPAVNAGNDQTVMLPRGEKTIILSLDANVQDDGKPGSSVKCMWTKISGGAVRFEKADTADTRVALAGAGTYTLKLSADDGDMNGSDTVRIVVEPYSAKVTKAFLPVDDAYIEGNAGINNEQLKIEGDRRIAFLKFNVSGLPSSILDAKLRLVENGDSGSGTISVLRGSDSNWTGATLQKSSAPTGSGIVGTRSGSVRGGESITIPVTSLIKGNGTYTVILTLSKGGDDIWFGSSESGKSPELIIVAEDPEGR